MKVWAVSKMEVERDNKMDVPHVIVSINTPGKPQATPKVNGKTLATLFLCFHDLDAPAGDAFRKVFGLPIVFSMAVAGQVIEFLDTWNPEGVICQCEAGLSRSAGLAAALSKYFNREDSQFFPGAGVYGARGYTPNRLVYNRMLEALFVAKGSPGWMGS